MGIIEVAAMPAAIDALEQAVRDDEAARAKAQAQAKADDTVLGPRDGVTLRQRAWPLIEMLRRSSAEDAVIVWGI